MSPLRPSVMQMSTDVLEHILSEDECDVDPINRVDKATPLHLAIKLEDPEARWHIVESLLDAGADTTYEFSPSLLPRALLTISPFSIKDKYGETVLDIVSLEDRRTRDMILKARATASISKDDIASGQFSALLRLDEPWLIPHLDDDDEVNSGSDDD
jgi:uncharacterized protein